MPGSESPQAIFNHFNPPPCDFNDAFYGANGISVTQLDQPAGEGLEAVDHTQPTRDGGDSGLPTMYRSPPMASPIAPNPARWAYGPVWP